MLLLVFTLLVAVSSVFALNPNRRITQYGHTAWRVLDGYFAAPTAITQTADGYVWLGTRDGVLRFDGVKFTPLTLPEGQSLPTSGVSWLLGATDGSLWIGTTGGIAQWKDGQLNDFAALRSKGGIGTIIEDETGAAWFTRYRISPGLGPLCRIKENELRCFGKEDGVPVTYGQGLAKDAAGNFWISSSKLVRWRETESSEIFFEKELERTGGDGVTTVAIGSAGQIWAALDATGEGLGVRYYSEGKWSSYAVPGFNGKDERALSLYRDRHDSLWVGSTSNGLYRIRDGAADHYGMENGLSGNSVELIYEDREGNVWIQTDNGIDMFRDMPVVNFSTTEGLSGTGMYSILALENNSVWIGARGGVDIIQPTAGNTVITTLKGLPAQDVESMVEDRAGRVLMKVGKKLLSYEQGRFSEVKKPDGSFLGDVGTVWSIIAGNDDDAWALIAGNKQRRLLRIKDDIVREDISLDNFTSRSETIAADREGAIWIGSARDRLDRYRNGEVETIKLGEAGDTTIYHLLIDSDDSLWAATNKGMFRWKNGVLNLLDSQSGLPCSTFFSALEDDSGNFWLYARCGLLEIPASSISAWRRQPESKVSFKIFDALDGALPSSGSVHQPRTAKTKDGRLWFLNSKSVQMIDPNVSYSNKIQPPVYIERLAADRQSYPIQGHVNLPPLRSELQIDYTALSYAVPQKINFRYRLEGHEENWHDAGARRQAFYNDLAPGQYRFRVIAGNSSDDVWNETGASLDFTVEPAWYQTTAFRVFCLLLAGLIVWALYRIRIKQISKVINARFDERLAERTRLARELHDTFLQTVQGSKLVADDALEQSDDPVRMRRALTQLSGWLGQATNEGRAALNSLRATTTEMNDLAEAFRRATENCRLGESAKVEFSVVGDSRDMHPIVRDEIYRIGSEAINNACRHSEASRLEVELRYAQDLSFRVIDNGIGISPLVAAEGKEGHFGLRGMRERADRIGAKLTIVSSETSGTEVTLVVPGGIIFTKTLR